MELQPVCFYGIGYKVQMGNEPSDDFRLSFIFIIR